MKKLLIWDGDETLWRGTLLEGAVPELPPGRLELCQELHDRGVLQSLASHNLEPDALTALHALGLDSLFLVPQASLVLPKPIMVRSIVEALNLARMEDVVFVDDQPAQRAEVEQGCPGILVASPTALDRVVVACFTKASYTDEDRKRTRLYQAELVRKAQAAAYPGDRQAFLRSCQLKLAIRAAERPDLPRVMDLVQRAHRMSALAREFSDQELAELVYGGHMLVGAISDRFGEYGLSALIAARDGHVQLLVVTCRLQGKGIGSALLGHWINQHVGQCVEATWQATAYNTGMVELYRWYGFELFQSVDTVQCAKAVTAPVTLPDWIEVLA